MLRPPQTGDRMADKQPLNATFFAFRKRERGGVLLRLTGAFLIAMIVLFAAFAAVFWGSLLSVISWYADVIAASTANDTEAMQAIGLPTGLFAIIGATLLWLFPVYILCAAYEAGCLRWMIHGEVKGFMGLSLGAPTWRVWSVYWIWFLLHMGFSIVMSIVMMLMMGVMAVGSGGDPMATMTVLPVYYVLQYGLMIFFAVRFAPAAATSVARGRFSFFDAWTVTKGRFWALLGSFLLLYVIYIAVSLVLGGVWFASVFGAAAPDLSEAAANPEQFGAIVAEVMRAYVQSLSQPQSWILIGVLQVIGLVVMALFYIATFGINARAAQAALEEGKIQPAT